MPRRIDIELTSSRPDGSWTWRAAGAREPKGVLDGSLLPSEAKAGDVLKAEADFEMEGIHILSVQPPKADARPQPARIEVVGPPRSDTPGVTTQLVGRSDRRPSDRRRDRDDNRPPRQERTGGRPGGSRDGGRPGRDGAGAAEGRGRPRQDGDSTRPDRSRNPDRPRRPDSPAEAGARRGAPRPSSGAERIPRGEGGSVERSRARRLTPGTTHRTAALESLPPEQQPIAEQLLRGGIPAVRTALHLEREKAEAEGRAVPNTDELVAIAEALLPKLKAAEWRDKAEAAAADADGISLRDLRSVVVGADAARDDETRALGASLRDTLEARVAKLHTDWAAEIVRHLDEQKVIRALRLSSRPPEPSAKLDAELSARLATAAGESMAPDATPDLWAALLDAVAASPVRRAVKPVGLPENAPPELKRAAHQHSGTIPALAKLLGVAIPPPPLPSAPRRSTPDRSRGPRTTRPAGPAGRSGPPPIPPPPAASAAPAPTGPETGSPDGVPSPPESGEVRQAGAIEAAPAVPAIEAAPEMAAIEAAPAVPAIEAAPEMAAIEAAPLVAELEPAGTGEPTAE